MTASFRIPPPSRVTGVLFDLDGTLTVAVLDWPRIRAEIGASTRSVLEHLAALPPDEAARAWQIVRGHEARAAAAAAPARGAPEMMRSLAARGVAVGVVTNNARETVTAVLERLGFRPAVLVCREDAPGKPSPEPLHSALRDLRVPTEEAVFVGDAEMDVDAGRAAGVHTIHVGPACRGRCDAHAPDLAGALALLAPRLG